MKEWLILTSILVVSILLLGMIGKNTFRDEGIMSIRTVEDIQGLDCNVNQIFIDNDVDSFITDYKDIFFGDLQEGVEIYVVKPTNNIRQYNFTMTQEVKIIEVISGEANIDSKIELVTSGGVYDQKYKYHNYENSRPIFYGMMNIMFTDNSYLVFLTPLNINSYSKTIRYHVAFPLFSYFNLSNDYSMPIEKPENEISYNDFNHSEFLCDSFQTLERLLQFKERIITKYQPTDK